MSVPPTIRVLILIKVCLLLFALYCNSDKYSTLLKEIISMTMQSRPYTWRSKADNGILTGSSFNKSTQYLDAWQKYEAYKDLLVMLSKNNLQQDCESWRNLQLSKAPVSAGFSWRSMRLEERSARERERKEHVLCQVKMLNLLFFACLNHCTLNTTDQHMHVSFRNPKWSKLGPKPFGAFSGFDRGH